MSPRWKSRVPPNTFGSTPTSSPFTTIAVPAVTIRSWAKVPALDDAATHDDGITSADGIRRISSVLPFASMTRDARTSM